MNVFKKNQTSNDFYKRQKTMLNSEFNNLPFSPKKRHKRDDYNIKNKRMSLLGCSSPIEEEYEKIAEELDLLKRNTIEIDNIRLMYRTDNDIFAINRILKEDNILYHKGNEISFFDIVFFILKKNNKRILEIEILKIFFLKVEKLIALFKPLNVSLNDMLGKLVGHIRYEKKINNHILFKEGDKGDKFYIILKGEVGILIHQERIIHCTPIEYLKCLMILSLYQEKSLVSKSIIANKNTLKYDDRCFSTLMDIFKFYYFYTEYSIVKKPYKDIIEFIRSEIEICKYLQKKNDFLPEESFKALNLSDRFAQELYNFYQRIIDNLKNFFWTGIPNINNNRQKEPTFNTGIINNPTDLSEFGLYYQTHGFDERKHNYNEFLERLYLINELSNNVIRSCNVNDYIQRLNCEEIINLIRKDEENATIKIYEDKNIYKYYSYFEVNKLKDGNIFGELALINPSKKRTATVIIREDCHLGVLNKESYDISIKNAQHKLRVRNLAFFINGPIFNGIANNYFLKNYFFRFKKKVFKSGEVLFHRGEIRTKIFFIINGELQLNAKMTLKKLTEIINYLSDGKKIDDGGLSKKYCRESFQFKRFYEDIKKTFRLYVLKDKEICGLDDMTENNIYLFDCVCVSLEPTEVYELDYKIYEEVSEDKNVKKNNDDYVAMKKELLVNRLYGQRDSMAKNEFNKIKAFMISVDRELVEEKKNFANNSLKTVSNCFPLNKTIINRKMFSLEEELNNININNISNYKKFPPLNTTRNVSSYAEIKNKSTNNKALKTDNDENSLFSKQCAPKPIKLKDSNQTEKDKSLILLQINKENKDNKVNKVQTNKSSNLLKIDISNMTNIASYINNNNRRNINYSYPVKNTRLVKQVTSIKSKSILKRKFNPTSKMLLKEFTKKYIEPMKTSYLKKHKNFIFDNQKIFEPLLNNKSSNKISSTLEESFKNDEIIFKEKNFKGRNKQYIICNENENYEYSTNRKIRNNNSSVRNIKLNKNKDNKFDEHYKDINFIDCLCLDKWEEKNNKYTFKKKAKLKGKKILK